MLNYEKGIIPEQFAPKLGYWTNKRKATISEIAQLANGVEPNTIYSKNKSAKLDAHLEKYKNSKNKENLSVDILKNRILDTYDILTDQLKKDGHLEGKGSNNLFTNQHKVNIDDAFDFLDYQKISYPEELKERYRPLKKKIYAEDRLDNNRRFIAALILLLTKDKKGPRFTQEKVVEYLSNNSNYKSITFCESTIKKIISASNKFNS